MLNALRYVQSTCATQRLTAALPESDKSDRNRKFINATRAASHGLRANDQQRRDRACRDSTLPCHSAAVPSAQTDDGGLCIDSKRCRALLALLLDLLERLREPLKRILVGRRRAAT
jgi:hypothetical protein